jgi:hypothetical protein
MGCAAISTRAKNTTAEIAESHAKAAIGVVEPVVARPVLEDVFERTEKARHGGKPDPVEIAENGKVRFVEIDQRQGRNGHADAGQHVDEEQPAP